ncbi:NAD(P)/FAD-dependent oxidoreductase [Patescibacteria group bacterium]|nr:NAD(P)/FAD-dependent oxidoreductase [Patescibacteria group bacterium]
MENKILIIGGGPAGSSAGIFLKKNGFDVTIFEKCDEHRVKVCGEGLTPEACNMLEKIGVLEKIKEVSHEVSSITLFDLNAQPIFFNNKCYTLKRSVLDKILRDEFVNLGGSVLYKTPIKKINVFEGRVVLEDLKGQKYDGDVVILATGAENSLAKSLGFNSVQTYSMALMRGYIKNTIDCKSLDFYYHDSYFPNGGWVFPLPGGILNVGVGCDRDSYAIENVDKLMDKFLKLLRDKYGESLGELYSSEKWIINSGLNTSNIFSDRVLLCGENISSAYNFSGEGVAPSLKTGFYAASAIIDSNGDYSSVGFSSYKEKVEKGIGPTHKIYNTMYRMLTKKIGSKIVCWFLRHSKKAKKLVEGVINEEVPLKHGFISAIWYSRKL